MTQLSSTINNKQNTEISLSPEREEITSERNKNLVSTINEKLKQLKHHETSPQLKQKTVIFKRTKRSTPLAHSFFREQLNLMHFVNEKSKKFGVDCTLKPTTDDDMAMSGVGGENSKFQININGLYLFSEKSVDFFLKQNPSHSASIKKFLEDEDPGLIDQAASDLIDWYNNNVILNRKVTNNDANQIIAKGILIMHSQGQLADIKHFLLTHEMGHAYDKHKMEAYLNEDSNEDSHNKMSLGDFDGQFLNFIQMHQYSEVRADLTAARELNAHALGMKYFNWRAIIARQPPENDVHPTDRNRAKALNYDYVNINISIDEDELY